MDLFAELCELPAATRAARLAELAEVDAVLAAQVATLLARDASTDGERSLIHPRIVERLLATVEAAEGRRSVASLPQLEGRYRLLRVIGEGGMGTVYEAEQVAPRRLVALKALRSSTTAGDRALRRFALEAEVLARLQHPGIAQVYEAGFAEEDGEGPAWIAMELVRGEPIVAACRRRGIGRSDRLRLFLAVCEAVAFAHQRGVIHRDLKPPNILLAEPDPSARGEDDLARLGQPKILDFGVARVVGDEWRREVAGSLTDAGQIVGTLAYMSPEQLAADSDAIDVRSDVYALGVVLYELLADRRPFAFEGGDLARSIRAAQESDPPPLARSDPTLAGDLSSIVAMALAKDPRRRYQSVGSLAADVAAHLAGEPIAARADSVAYVLSRRLRRYRWPIALAGLALAALVLFAIRSAIDAERFANLARAEQAASAAAESARAALARELALSRLDQARLLAKDGSLEAAERLVRGEYAASPTRDALWTVREVTARHPSLDTMRHHADRVWAVGFLPDGSLSAGEDLRLVRLDEEGAIRACVDLSAPPMPGVPLLDEDSDAATLVLADGRIERFDADTLVPLGTVATVPPPRHAARGFGGIVVVGHDRRVLVVDERDGSVREHPPTAVHPTGLARIDAERIAYGGNDGVVRVRRIDSDDAIELRGHEGYPHLFRFDPATHRLITSGQDRTIRFWDADSWRQVDILDGGNGQLGDVVLMPDGSLITTGWWGIDRWDLEARTRRRLASLPGGALATAVEGDRVLTGHIGEVRLWSATPGAGRPGPRLVGRTASALSPDGTIATFADAAGDVQLLDGATGAPLRRLLPHHARVRTLAFSADGTQLVTGGDDREVRVHDVATGLLLGRRTDADIASHASAAFSPDGRMLAMLAADRSLRVLALPQLSEIVRMPLGALQPISVAWSPDGARLVTTARDNRVRLWSLDGRQLAEAGLEMPVWSAAFSADGSRIAVGTWGRVIVLYDAATLREIGRLRGPAGLVTAVRWHPREHDLLLASSADGALRIWSVDTARLLFTLEPFASGDMVDCAIAADGRRIAASGAWGESSVWDVAEWDRWIDGARGEVASAAAPPR